MFEDQIINIISILGMVGIGAGLWYKLGKLEEKVDFIYQACNIELSFKIRPKKQEVDCNGLEDDGYPGAHGHRQDR